MNHAVTSGTLSANLFGVHTYGQMLNKENKEALI